MTDSTSRDSERDGAIRELLDYLWAAHTNDDEDAIEAALDTWSAVHTVTEIGVVVRRNPDAPEELEVDLGQFQAHVEDHKFAAKMVAWQLLEFMSEQTGRTKKDLLGELDVRLMRRD